MQRYACDGEPGARKKPAKSETTKSRFIKARHIEQEASTRQSKLESQESRETGCRHSEPGPRHGEQRHFMATLLMWQKPNGEESLARRESTYQK